jgi:hypothetical protein
MRTVVFYHPEYWNPDTVPVFSDVGNGKIRGPYWSFAPQAGLSDRRIPTRTIDLNGEAFEVVAKNYSSYPPGSQGHETTVGASEFYPRIWRGWTFETARDVTVPEVSKSRYLGNLISSLEQVESLFDSLAKLFRVAHPAPDNLDAYGGAIRELMILAATEVEAQWKGVLVANNYPCDKPLRTNDYCKLLSAMRLDQYTVKLLRYPDVGDLTPFSGWNASAPTQSLPWYDAYNAVKHDREANFAKAQLGHAINAVAGCVVMLAAQFGEPALRTYGLEKMFQFVKLPCWEPEHWYFGSDDPTENWTAVNYPF